MIFEDNLKNLVIKGFEELFHEKIDKQLIQIQKTREDFQGDFTIVVFPLLRFSKKNPEETATLLADFLIKRNTDIVKYNVIKGFLNISLSTSFWLQFLKSNLNNENFGFAKNNPAPKTFMIEFSSPNTNKPLHLGHIRNNFLGNSVSEILKANGNNVIKVNLVNDRGIHICKSMLAWKEFSNGETPENSNIKGDHLVGKYYVKYDEEYKRQVNKLIEEGLSEDEAKITAPILKSAQQMLRLWEANDPEIQQLWKKMNEWVYKGFDETYTKLGIVFDKIYYESDTFIIGRKKVEEGLKQNIFYKKDDGSVWIDLSNNGLDHKLLLRNDGTTVYMTQDIGTAIQRVNDYKFDEMIYVVGNEQEYHFKVLSKILDKLGFEWARNLTHLSYGMVELPTGRMKSREGKVVDADDLMDEMIDTSKKMSKELGKLEGLNQEEKEKIYEIIGMGALKYFILKVDPKKNMTFNPEESVDFNGNTGPFIQYTYARINSIFKKANDQGVQINNNFNTSVEPSEKEIQLIKLMYKYPEVISEAAINYSPALIANYTYNLVKSYNQFYHDFPVLKEKNKDFQEIRFAISKLIASIIKSSMSLLGVEVPKRM